MRVTLASAMLTSAMTSVLVAPAVSASAAGTSEPRSSGSTAASTSASDALVVGLGTEDLVGDIDIEVDIDPFHIDLEPDREPPDLAGLPSRADDPPTGARPGPASQPTPSSPAPPFGPGSGQAAGPLPGPRDRPLEPDSRESAGAAGATGVGGPAPSAGVPGSTARDPAPPPTSAAHRVDTPSTPTGHVAPDQGDAGGMAERSPAERVLLAGTNSLGVALAALGLAGAPLARGLRRGPPGRGSRLASGGHPGRALARDAEPTAPVSAARDPRTRDGARCKRG
ncbi:hypothetical protein [Parafrankia sp. FMc2]|uniref:hypothetical protein n=1 Tax=Parafrankia sp. FMc2 TaxID=3233196 RepID=UPI0034D5AD71